MSGFLRRSLSLFLLGLAACSAAPETREGDTASFLRIDRALMDAGRMKADRLARDVPLTPDMLAQHFGKVAFGEEFTLANGVTRQLPQDAAGLLRKWTGPVKYTLSGHVRVRDQAVVRALTERLARRTGLPFVETGPDDANLQIHLLTAAARADLGAAFQGPRKGSPLAPLFAAWNDAPNWPCAGEIYFQGPNDARRYEIAFAVIYVRDEVTGLSRQACLEEEISQAMGLIRDDPTVRPSIFNDDEEYVLLTRHDELLLAMLYDPRLRPGMARGDAAPIVAELAAKVLAE